MNAITKQRIEHWSAGLRTRLRGPLSLDASPTEPPRQSAMQRRSPANTSQQAPTSDRFLEFIPLPAVAAQAPSADPAPTPRSEPEPHWSPL